MSTPVKKIGSVERAFLDLLVRDLEALEGSEERVGGDWPRQVDDFYIRIDRGPGGRSTSFEGDYLLDVDVFSQDYIRAEDVSEDIESLLLSHGIVSVTSRGKRWVFDGIFQNRGITDLPWDGDDDTHRLSASYAVTVRRGAAIAGPITPAEPVPSQPAPPEEWIEPIPVPDGGTVGLEDDEPALDVDPILNFNNAMI